MFEKKRFLIILFVFVGLIALAACAPKEVEVTRIVKETVVEKIQETVVIEGTPQVVEREVTRVVEVEKEVTATPEPKELVIAGPVTFRTSFQEGLDTYNPFTSWIGWLTYLLMHDGLFDDAGYGVIPKLADSWTASDDGLVWTFHIVEGVTFHDGSAFNAEEAAWFLNLVKDYKLGNIYSSDYENVEEIVALDPTTLQVTLIKPMAEGPLTYMLTSWMLPRSVWEGMTLDEMLAYNEPDAAIGLGPYKLVDLKPGEYEVLEAHEGSVSGKAAIDRIVMQQYASIDAEIEALLADEVDMAYEVPFTAVPRLLKEDNIYVAVLDTRLIGYLSLNSAEEGTQPESLSDPAVRQAIELSIDKQKITDVAYLGYAEPLDTLLPSSMGDWHNSDISISFDVDEAKRILEEAGYVDTDGDGIREGADGTPLQYRIYGLSEPLRVRIMEIIIEGLTEVGIGTVPTTMGWDGVLGVGASYDYDLLILSGNLSPEPTMALGFFACAQKGGTGFNFSGYCDEEYEQMFAQQSQTIDPEERRAIIWQMQEKLFEDKPYIMTICNKRVDAYRSDHFENFGEDSAYILWDDAVLQASPVQ